MHPSLKNAPVFVAACAASMRAGSAFAHEGHGLAGGHWHPTDAWGFMAALAFVALAYWLSRGKK